MHDTAIPMFCRRRGTLCLAPFSDIDVEQWHRLILCRFFSAWFCVSWGPGEITFN